MCFVFMTLSHTIRTPERDDLFIFLDYFLFQQSVELDMIFFRIAQFFWEEKIQQVS